MKVIKGYKVFNSNWTARHDNFQYEVGKEYEMGGEITPCKRGFHFCEKLDDCFKYYIFNPDLKVAEVEGTGQIKREENKICCSHIRIVKEIPMTDALNLANDGEGNIGVHNQGYNNQGNCNQGYNNQGNCNQGNNNQGHYNIGNCNHGNGNHGNDNQGNYNQGNYNLGNYHQGDGNIGIGNKGNSIAGIFCTQEQPFYLFNKLCSMSLEEFKQSENYRLLMRLAQTKNPKKEWKTFSYGEKRITLSTENITPEIFKELFDIDMIGDI